MKRHGMAQVQKLFDELIREFAQGAFEGQGAQDGHVVVLVSTGRPRDPMTSLAVKK